MNIPLSKPVNNADPISLLLMQEAALNRVMISESTMITAALLACSPSDYLGGKYCTLTSAAEFIELSKAFRVVLQFSVAPANSCKISRH